MASPPSSAKRATPPPDTFATSSLSAALSDVTASAFLPYLSGDVAFALAEAARSHMPPVEDLPPALEEAPLTLDDVGPLVAQAGFRHAADTLARVNRYLRGEERVARSCSRLALGLYGRTRLAAAARVGDVDRCAFLVAHGARVDARDRHHRSPLTEALAGGHAACAAWLRAHGAVEDAAFVGTLVDTWGPSFLGRDHFDPSWAVCSVLDGRGVAAAHESGLIRLHDAASGATTSMLRGHTDALYALAALEGGRLASAGEDLSVRVWVVASGACVAVLAGHTNAIHALAVLRDGRLCSASSDRSVRVWDTRARCCVAVLAHEEEVWSLAPLPCGGLAAGTSEGRVALWTAGGVREGYLGGGYAFGYVLGLAALPEGRLAAGYSDAPDGTPPQLRLWNVRGRSLDAAVRGIGDWVRSPVLLRDGRLVTACHDRTLKVWDGRVLGLRGGRTVGGESAVTLEGGHLGCVFHCAALPDGRVASGGSDGTVRLWK